jgi:hypothetical protein
VKKGITLFIRAFRAQHDQSGEDRFMRTRIGLAGVVGFFGLLATANAQAPSPSGATTSFDGTYRFVSSAKISQTYTTRNGQTGECPYRRAGPLHVVRGRVHYTTATGYRLSGTVGPQGQLAMRIVAPPNTSNAGSFPLEINANGTIDSTGTARAREIGHSCSYDFVWRK